MGEKEKKGRRGGGKEGRKKEERSEERKEEKLLSNFHDVGCILNTTLNPQRQCVAVFHNPKP